MGWTCSHKSSDQSVVDFLREHFDCDNDSAQWKVLDGAVVKFHTAYLAVEMIPKDSGVPYVFGLVVLLKYDHRSYHNFCWKDIDEGMWPCDTECPERILRRLTPLDAPAFPGSPASKKNAAQWREACWARIHARKQRPPLKKGVRLKHAAGIRFSNGLTLHEFVVLDPRSTVVTTLDGGLYRLSRTIITSCEVMAA
ncbi:MAG: hypothetical protein IDH49_08125 [Gammaproteobacteria bacterium]|nr:hypothetical protein [Gammaproteobacteria bacterium]